MKKALLILITLILLFRFLYPHTRFGFKSELNMVSGKHLNVQTATLRPGEKISIKLAGIKKAAYYSSSDFRIASVSPSGTVHALKPGTAIIYVKQDSKTYKCKINVVKVSKH